MSETKTDLPPDQLWALITQTPRPTRLVDFPRKLPGTDEPLGHVAMRVLTHAEQSAALSAAEEYTRGRLKEPPKKGEENLGYENIYKNSSSIELLYRACRREDDHMQPAFPSPKLMREQLTADEVGVLVQAYLILQAEAGPIVAQMSDDEVEAWIERLEKAASAFPLAFLSSEAVNELVMHLVSRLRSSSTATSSPGLPSDESTTPASADDDPALTERDDVE